MIRQLADLDRWSRNVTGWVKDARVRRTRIRRVRGDANSVYALDEKSRTESR